MCTGIASMRHLLMKHLLIIHLHSHLVSIDLILVPLPVCLLMLCSSICSHSFSLTKQHGSPEDKNESIKFHVYIPPFIRLKESAPNHQPWNILCLFPFASSIHLSKFPVLSTPSPTDEYPSALNHRTVIELSPTIYLYLQWKIPFRGGLFEGCSSYLDRYVSAGWGQIRIRSEPNVMCRHMSGRGSAAAVATLPLPRQHFALNRSAHFSPSQQG